MHYVTARNIGGPRTPHDVQRLRRNNIETLKRFGQPVVWKHMFTQDDFELGYYSFQIAHGASQKIPVQRCVACWDEDYQQTRTDCPICHGIGITSVEAGPYWIDQEGYISESSTLDPAPKYRGFGPSILTWTIQPDVPEDVFRISDEGVLTRVQTATVLAPWTPEMADNDLLVNVVLQQNDYSILKEQERFILRQVAPQSVRGYGKYARNREFRAGQQFQMTKLPTNNHLYNVPILDVYHDSGVASGAGAPFGVDSGPYYDSATARGHGLILGIDLNP